jgi:hypothetical protein
MTAFNITHIEVILNKSLERGYLGKVLYLTILAESKGHISL